MSPKPMAVPHGGFGARARWCTVRIETDRAVYVGRVYVPETKKRLSDVLCDERPFLSLTDVSINGSGTLEPFMALNKQFIHTARIVDEGEPLTISRNRTA